MSGIFEFEISKGASILVNELALVTKDDIVTITADTMCEAEVVNAIAGAVHAVGAKFMVIWYPFPRGVGKAADPDIPYQAIGEALGASTVWIELGYNWILYSSAQEIAMKKNPSLRHINAVGLNREMFYRLIVRSKPALQAKFQHKLNDMTKAAKHVRITNPSGTDLEFDNDPNCPFYVELGICDHPGTAYLAGQICWFPTEGSTNGTLAFDGSISPSNGIVTTPVLLDIENGYVKKVRGGADAQKFEAWLASFNDPLMYRMAHVCYGCHPNAKLTGDCVEDERIWGSTEWGIGYLPPCDCPPNGINAASHCDGITLNTSLWLDGVQIMDNGEFIHPELKEMADELKNS